MGLPDELPELGEEIQESNRESQIRLGIGDYAITEEDKMTCHGLGSCVATFLYDPVSGVGSGIHTLLPRESEYIKEKEKEKITSTKKSKRFTDTGIEFLYDEMTKNPNVEPDRLVAKITGGSDVLRLVTYSTNIGRRNVSAAKETIQKLGVPITGEDVGGNSGRIVEFNPQTGGVVIRNANGEQNVI